MGSSTELFFTNAKKCRRCAAAASAPYLRRLYKSLSEQWQDLARINRALEIEQGGPRFYAPMKEDFRQLQDVGD